MKKIVRVLAHLLAGVSVNRFEAERIGDHCLHSTISTLANNYQLTIRRQRERVPTRWGKVCVVTRYSLPASEHERARATLANLSRAPRATD